MGEAIDVRCKNIFQVLARGGVRGGSGVGGEVRVTEVRKAGAV